MQVCGQMSSCPFSPKRCAQRASEPRKHGSEDFLEDGPFSEFGPSSGFPAASKTRNKTSFSRIRHSGAQPGQGVPNVTKMLGINLMIYI